MKPPPCRWPFRREDLRLDDIHGTKGDGVMKRRSGTLGLVVGFLASSCGKSDVNSSADVIASCNAYCAAVIAKNCPDPPYSSLEECKTSECSVLAKAPASCQTPLKTYYECEASQADLCADEGCTSQFAAVARCASGGGGGGGGASGTVDAGRSGSGGKPTIDASAEAGPDATVGPGTDPDPCATPVTPPSAGVLAPAPVARWSGDGNANDSAGGRHGMLSPSGVTFTAGVRGQAFSLDGVSGWVSLPDGPIVSTDRDFAVAAWVRVPKLEHQEGEIYYSAPELGEFILKLGASDRPTFGVKFASMEWRQAESTCPLPTGRWVFLVGVRRPNAVELWMDGSLKANLGAPDEDTIRFSGFSHSAIGAYPPSGLARYFFHGDIDELRLFDTAPSRDQIVRMFLDERPL
jgi:hypothetical protein